MGAKFSIEALPNRNGEDWELDLRRGSTAAMLHNFARFGMLGATELILLHGLHDRHIYRTLQLLKAENAKYIKLTAYQDQRKNRMVSTPLYYELASNGRAFNEQRDIPDYEPLAGNDF